MELYLAASFGVAWPRTAEDVVSYMEARAAKPCGASVLGSAVDAFRYMEAAGEASPGSRLSDSPIIGNLLGSCHGCERRSRWHVQQE